MSESLRDPASPMATDAGWGVVLTCVVEQARGADGAVTPGWVVHVEASRGQRRRYAHVRRHDTADAALDAAGSAVARALCATLCAGVTGCTNRCVRWAPALTAPEVPESPSRAESGTESVAERDGVSPERDGVSPERDGVSPERDAVPPGAS